MPQQGVSQKAEKETFCQENPRSEKSMQQTEEQRNLICDKLLLTAIAYLCGENHNQRQYNNDSCESAVGFLIQKLKINKCK